MLKDSQRAVSEAAHPCCSVVELRQYTLQPSRRDELIELFDREFVESQEAVGTHVVAQFRDLDEADRFVWVRGFTNMVSRRSALEDFYGGPVWRAHRAAAVATMIDSDDVLLLRPAFENAGLIHPPAPRPSPGHTTKRSSAIIVATIHTMNEPVPTEDVRDFAAESDAISVAQRGRPLAWYVTESAENTFPVLPVRTDVSVLVSIAVFDSEEHHRTVEGRHADREAASMRFSATTQLRLAPTGRSQLR